MVPLLLVLLLAACNQTTTPAIPTNLSATNAAPNINLTWNASPEATGYVLQRKTGSGSFVQIAAPSTNSYADASVTSNTTFSYRVKAKKNALESGYSSEKSITTPPAAPTNLQLASKTSTSATLSWVASVGATSYSLERKTGSGGFSAVSNGATSPFSDSGLSASTAYIYRLKAKSAGGDSAYTPELSVTTNASAPPPVPTNFQSTSKSSATVTLSWSASAGASSYILERKTGAAAFAVISANATSPYTDSGLSASTAYVYRLKAKNADGESAYTSELSVTTDAPPVNPPGTPSGVSGTATTAPAVSLTWNATSGASGYKVYRKTGSGSESQIAAPPGNSYLDASVAFATTYTYRVKASNSAGDSGFSSEFGISTLASPGNPSGLSATPTAASVSLTWSAPSTGGTVADYTVERKTDSDYGSPTVVSATNYTDNTVAASTTYTYRIKARNAAGSSTGVETTVTTSALAGAPGTPGNFRVTGVTADGLALAWDAPTSGGAVSNYILERKAVGGSYSQIATPTAATYSDSSLAANAVYIYRLKASNANGSSAAAETAGTTLISASCAVGSSDDVNAKGCFGLVDNSWKAVATHLAILPDGRVIYWYSVDNVGINREVPEADPSNPTLHASTEVWTWDPATGVHTQVNNNSTDLFCAGFTVLSDGRFFTAGGNLGSAWGSYRTNIFDPKTNQWTNGPDMNVAKGRWYPTVTKLADGKVLITGGSYKSTTAPDPSEPYTNSFQSYFNKDIERYDPSTNLITLLTPVMDLNSLEGYYPWWSVMPNGNVFLAGAAGTQILNPTGSGGWVTGILPRDGYSRTYGSAVTYQPGKMFVVGGGYAATNTSSFIDFTSGTPSITAGPGMDQQRTHLNATLLANGQIFINGGNKADSASFTCGGVACSSGARWQATGSAFKGLLIDPNAGSPAFGDAALAARVRIYHSTAALLPDGTVLTAGGGGCGNCASSDESYDGWAGPDGIPGNGDDPQPDGNTVQAVGNMGRKVNQLNAEIYYPPYLFSGGSFRRRPTIQEVSATALSYNTSFTITTPDASSISTVSFIALSATTHSFNENQRFVSLSFSQSGNTLTVTSPQSGNYAPPGYYLLFILKDGVPSISRIVRIS